MQNQFKPGDLALIVGCRRDPSCIGKSGALIEFLAPEQTSKWRDPDGYTITNSDDEHLWLISFGSREYAAIAPRFLMPLKGTETPQLEKQKEVEHG